MDPHGQVIELIDQKIEDILEIPKAWGGEYALESLIWCLLTLRQETLGGSVSDLRRAYNEHMTRLVVKGNLDLRTKFLMEKGETLPHMVDFLREFWQAVKRNPAGLVEGT